LSYAAASHETKPDGLAEIPDSVIVEIIDDIYLPLVQVGTPI
jgi:hypothetical protein